MSFVINKKSTGGKFGMSFVINKKAQKVLFRHVFGMSFVINKRSKKGKSLKVLFHRIGYVQRSKSCLEFKC